MKKIIIALVILGTTKGHAFDWTYRRFELGLFLVTGGLFMIFDGARSINKAIPSLSIIPGRNGGKTEIKKENGSWLVNYTGIANNIGNVTLKNIEIQIKCLDASGNTIDSSSFRLNDILTGHLERSRSGYWSYSSSGLNNEPKKVEFSATYEHDKLMETKSVGEVTLGLIFTGLGIKLLYDESQETSWYSKLREKGWDVRIASTIDKFSFSTIKFF